MDVVTRPVSYGLWRIGQALCTLREVSPDRSPEDDEIDEVRREEQSRGRWPYDSAGRAEAKRKRDEALHWIEDLIRSESEEVIREALIGRGFRALVPFAQGDGAVGGVEADGLAAGGVGEVVADVAVTDVGVDHQAAGGGKL